MEQYNKILTSDRFNYVRVLCMYTMELHGYLVDVYTKELLHSFHRKLVTVVIYLRVVRLRRADDIN